MTSHESQTFDPHDRLTRVAEAMLEALEALPDTDEVKAIVLLSDGNKGGAAFVGWDRAGEVVVELLQHAQAVAKANDIPLAITEMPGWPGAKG